MGVGLGVGVGGGIRGRGARCSCRDADAEAVAKSWTTAHQALEASRGRVDFSCAFLFTGKCSVCTAKARG